MLQVNRRERGFTSLLSFTALLQLEIKLELLSTLYSNLTYLTDLFIIPDWGTGLDWPPPTLPPVPSKGLKLQKCQIVEASKNRETT